MVVYNDAIRKPMKNGCQKITKHMQMDSVFYYQRIFND